MKEVPSLGLTVLLFVMGSASFAGALPSTPSGASTAASRAAGKTTGKIQAEAFDIWTVRRIN